MQMCHSGVDIFVISRLRISKRQLSHIDSSCSAIKKWWASLMPRAFDVNMILYLSQDDKLSSCGLWMFQISTMANFKRIFWTFEAFLLVHAIMTKLVHMWSKLTILPWVSRFFNFSHDNTPTLMVFREISFWNEMFLCSLTTEMFTVAVS